MLTSSVDGYVLRPLQTPAHCDSFPGPNRSPLMPPPRRLNPDRVAEYLPRLYRAARAWTDSREEAEDLVQETSARVLARPRFIRGEGELGYLLRALRNTLVSQRRSQSRRPATTPFEEELAGGSRSADDPAQAAELREVHAAIAELPEDFRDALVAVDIAGLSYPEAARALRIPEGTLTSRLFRARDRVAGRLGGESPR
jgi:RNA polymerase sigma-70 factor (ECF subfamily)